MEYRIKKIYVNFGIHKEKQSVLIIERGYNLLFFTLWLSHKDYVGHNFSYGTVYYNSIEEANEKIISLSQKAKSSEIVKQY